MMIECFMVHPSGSGPVKLTRYSQAKCKKSPTGHHEATTMAGDNAAVARDHDGHVIPIGAIMYDGHHNWPKRCLYCAYEFDLVPPRADHRTTADDGWGVTIKETWRASDGRQWYFEDLPPGAMYDAFWTEWRGPDNMALTVVLPGSGHWQIDGPATTGRDRPWTRTGVAPVVTVSPSVKVAEWTGFLIDGHLGDSEEWARQQHPAGKG